jgi:RNA polymerase sigma-70 factor (ECF subfamily)
MSTDLDRWFAAEILSHEGALTRYLRRIWRHAADIPDLRQEIYVRVYESAAKALPASAKSFLFTSARNLIADRLRRERVVSIDYTQDMDALNVLIDEISPERRLSARQELKRIATAFDQLSDESRAVFWLRRVEGLSQREAAKRLGMLESTLSSHLCRSVRALMKQLLTSEGVSEAEEGAEESLGGSEHG